MPASPFNAVVIYIVLLGTLAIHLLVTLLRPSCSIISGQESRFRISVQSTRSSLESHPRYVTQESAKAAALFSPDLKSSCDQVEIDFQAKLIQMYLQGISSLKCPTFDYMPDFQPFLEKDVVMFDIGCNNGFDSAMFFESFAPSEKLKRSSLGKFYEANAAIKEQLSDAHSSGTCGGLCGDCRMAFGSTARRQDDRERRLQVHCFEPSATNFNILTTMHAHFLGGSNRTALGNELVLHRKAFADKPGVASIPDKCGQHCQLQKQTTGSPDSANMVPVTTVDDMMRHLNLEHIFLLKIDTEGHDPLVLKGARKALAAHKVTLILFEYNTGGAWENQFSLRQVVSDLERLGYICYFEGHSLTRITGCWTDAFEFKHWSNVVCAASSKPAQKVLKAYSVVPLKGRYVNS